MNHTTPAGFYMYCYALSLPDALPNGGHARPDRRPATHRRWTPPASDAASDGPGSADDGMHMSHIGPILTALLSLYALVVCVFLISANRRPHAALAWMLAFIFAPGPGVVPSILFCRDRQEFSSGGLVRTGEVEGQVG